MTVEGTSGETLAHTLVTDPAHGSPDRWMLWLHGIFGSGQNFRSLARSVLASAPGWGACLVDLRNHGRSPVLYPPHTLSAVAEDLVRLEGSLPGPVRGVLGHSFGGKAALAYLERRGEAIEQAIVLDASPSIRRDGLATETAGKVLAMLEAMSWPLPSRERFIEIVVEHGYERPIAEWLAMNVRHDDDGFRFRLDLEVIRVLLADYFDRDLWSVLETSTDTTRWVVIGGRSTVYTPADRTRLEALASSDPRLHVEVLERAGHWVHADDPTGVSAVVARALAGPTSAIG